MEQEINKVALVSGKLNGTKTLRYVLESIEHPDEVECFLKELTTLKIDLDIQKEAVYINDDQDLLEHLEQIENNEYISIYANENFSRLYLTTDNKITYIIRMNKVNHQIIAKFISKEMPIKFSLNSFHFIKWCVAQKIDMRNIYDIPTYIKILTNEVDPFKTIDDYVAQYTHYELNDDKEKNGIILGNFIYTFGKYLNENAKKFEVDSVCKLINENSYFEAIIKTTPEESCTIQFRYANLKQAIASVLDEKEKQFADKAYVISPLGRIALKFGHNVRELIEELYVEDISITILNELFNNNIHVHLNSEGNYIIHCKYKNVANVFSLINAILNDIFYTMFEQSFEATISCDIKV